MRRDRASPGLRFVIPFALPAYWEPSEALTVYELVDDLHCAIWARYESQLLDLVPPRRRPNVEDYFNTTIDDTAAVDIAIPATWSPEQACAVFGLLAKLRRQIWRIYRDDILFMTRRRRSARKRAKIELSDDDLPF